MNNFEESRRRFLKTAGIATGALLLSSKNSLAQTEATTRLRPGDGVEVTISSLDVDEGRLDLNYVRGLDETMSRKVRQPAVTASS